MEEELLMANDDVMVPTNDYVFKRIFGRTGNEDITKVLISAIIGQKVRKVELNDSPILDKDLKHDKVGVLDVKANLDGGKICNIEMQVTEQEDIEKRIMFYWSKLYFSQIKEGDQYEGLHKTIVILIAKFELDSIKEIGNFHTKWNIREEKFSKTILTDVLEVHIIELPKLMRQLKNNEISKKDKVALWSVFIMHPERIGEKEMSEDSFVKRAKEELTKIQQDERERYLAEQRLIQIREKKAIEAFGYDKGKKEGNKEVKHEVVINMYKEKFSIEDICRITKLSEKEVEEIIKDNK